MITHVDVNHIDEINVNWFGDTYRSKSINDVTKFSSAWESIVKSFKRDIDDYINIHGSVWDRRVNAPNPPTNKFHAQLSSMLGNWDVSYKKMYRDDFYTMVLKNWESNKGIRLPISNSNFTCGYYEFDTENERDNFIEYCKTDFARFCLSIYKNKGDLHRGELAIVPWMDFTRPWSDTALFIYFDIDFDTQNFIRSYIPDFHGIRNDD